MRNALIVSVIAAVAIPSMATSSMLSFSEMSLEHHSVWDSRRQAGGDVPVAAQSLTRSAKPIGALALHGVSLEIDEALWEDFERRRLEIGTATVAHVSGGSGYATGVARDIWYVRDGMGRGVRASQLARWLGDDDLLNEIASRKRTKRMVGLCVAGVGAAMAGGGVYLFMNALQNSSDFGLGLILGSTTLVSLGLPVFLVGLPMALLPGDSENLSTYRPRGQAERMIHRYNRSLAEELGLDFDRRQDKSPSPTQVRLIPGGVAVAGTF